MKVKATRLCYHGHRRRHPGDVFYVEDSQFSPAYMECLDGSVVNKAEEVAKPAGAKVDASMKMDELYQYCKDHGLKGYSGLDKSELIEAINSGDLDPRKYEEPVDEKDFAKGHEEVEGDDVI